jgi:hypothetical protein
MSPPVAAMNSAPRVTPKPGRLVRCLLDDRESLTVYTRFPREH